MTWTLALQIAGGALIVLAILFAIALKLAANAIRDMDACDQDHPINQGKER